MGHNRKLVLSGVALTKARLPVRQNGAAANCVRDELEAELIDSNYLEGAPFSWVGLIIRYGLKDEAIPHYQPINMNHGDLPLAIEVDVHRLLSVSEEQMVQVYREATLRALIHAGNKYRLPVGRLETLLEDLHNA